MKVRYKEFKTGEEVAEWYAAENIIQIVPLNPGFGVFSKIPTKEKIRNVIHGFLPGYVYFDDEYGCEEFKELILDLREMGFSNDEIEIAIETCIEELKKYSSPKYDPFYDSYEVKDSVITARNSNYFKNSQ